MAAMSEAPVIFVAHNPLGDYFCSVIEALRGQSLSPVKWELLLVDNASDVPLASLWDISWHPNARHFAKSSLDFAVARRRGMREAATEAFVVSIRGPCASRFDLRRRYEQRRRHGILFAARIPCGRYRSGHSPCKMCGRALRHADQFRSASDPQHWHRRRRRRATILDLREPL